MVIPRTAPVPGMIMEGRLMALPAGETLWYTRFHGTLSTTAEEFAYGMHWASSTPISPPTLATAMSAYLGSWGLTAVSGITGVTDIFHAFRTLVKWDQLYVVQVDESTAIPMTPGLITSLSQLGADGVAGRGSLPYQNSHCITYAWGATGVRTHRNRYYLPPYTSAVINNDPPVLPPSFMTAMGTAILNGITAAQGVIAGLHLAVYSPHIFAANHADKLYIGNVIDTQRRRRRSLPETRTTVTVP